MTFEDWMIHRGLSVSSVTKYRDAINGSLSQWAVDHGLMKGPLTSLTSHSTFKAVANDIRLLSIFQERNKRGHHMYSSALAQFAKYLSDGFENDVESDIELIFESEGLSGTEKSNLVKLRIGQGAFRQQLIAYWKKCSVTGFKDTSLLVASHIKPWRVAKNIERLDPFNGLLLTPNLDKVFDSGFVTFESNGQIKISPFFMDFETLGVTLDMRVALSTQHEPYMSFHRTEVYRSD